ncbi:MAG: VOC family protein [Actinobacteria bacterium]|nr:VOC family protein [Actinomycetota bacterium]
MAGRGYRCVVASSPRVDYLVLTLDVLDLDRQTTFWCEAFGYKHQGGVAQYHSLGDPADKMPKLLLQRVPEAKAAKNRLHIDFHVADVDAEAARIEALGATRVARREEFGLHWVTMQDPEGNEFCLVVS